MKKAMVAGLLAACLLAAGCSSAAGRNFGAVVEEWKQPPAQSAHKVAIVTYTSPAFGDTLGFDVTSYPDDAALKPHKFFALDGWYGQVEYKNPDDSNFVLRVAGLGGLYLVSTYPKTDSVSDETREIDGLPVRFRTDDKGAQMVTWERGDFQFLLHSNRIPPSDAEVERMVRELACRAVEGGGAAPGSGG